ncbi:MAG: glutamine amidotransferase [Candidatus Saccharimonadales bacterium]
MKKIVLAHLYPREMNIYGDWGNIVALTKRLEWRDYEVVYEPIGLGAEYDFSRADIVFGGGGQDRGQVAVADDLQRHREAIHVAAEQGTVFLLVCGLYQLFGHMFTTIEGAELPGIGLFDAETVGSSERLIGNVVVQTPWGEVVGFENHSGKTTLAPEQSALGRVVQGHGNNGEDGFEGAVVHNVFGTYLHGSLLPKNPDFTDELLRRALERRGDKLVITDKIDDSLAERAAAVAKRRPQ